MFQTSYCQQLRDVLVNKENWSDEQQVKFLCDSRKIESDAIKIMESKKQALKTFKPAIASHLSVYTPLISDLQSIVAEYATTREYMRFDFGTVLKWIMIREDNVDELYRFAIFVRLVSIYNEEHCWPNQPFVKTWLNFNKTREEILSFSNRANRNYVFVISNDLNANDKSLIDLVLSRYQFGMDIGHWVYQKQQLVYNPPRYRGSLLYEE
jgi:hypothetical protein